MVKKSRRRGAAQWAAVRAQAGLTATDENEDDLGLPPSPGDSSYYQDQVDEFHEARSRAVLAKGWNEVESGEEDGDEEEEVLPLDIDDGDDEDGESSEEEEVGEDDDGGSSVQSEAEASVDPSLSWGQRKKLYYDTDYGSKSRGRQSQQEVEEEEREEEEEAQIIQRRLAQALQEDDFGVAWVEAFAKPVPQVDEAETRVVKDLAKVSVKEKLKMLKKESPELLELIEDLQAKLTEVKDELEPLLQLVEKGVIPTGRGSEYLKTKYNLYLNYCANISFYLILKARRVPAHGHPVIERLVTYRNLINKLSVVDQKLSSEIRHLLTAKDGAVKKEMTPKAKLTKTKPKSVKQAAAVALTDEPDFDGAALKYSGEEKTWMWWHNFRTLCDYSKRIAVALEIGADLPSNHVIDRWLGEPIKAAILPTSIFLTNKKGFPVLSKVQQRLIFRLLKLEVQFIITGTNHHSEKEFCSYLQYLEYLSQNRPPPNAYELFAKGYEDYLQSPLQPLMDNLESQTYEVFEKDPIKYSQYQQAIYKCLLDRVPEEEKETNVQVLMVLGAGRGPLVNASLRAAKQAERRIRLYAVEKNPNAVVTLENWQFEEWGSQVTVVSSDMREWVAPEKADIIVSELLGSFADNELSPECLDGAQHFLKDDGVSIPGEYTSFLAPISSSKLYNEVRACREKDRDPEAQFEMPYVVRLHNFHQLSAPKPCFTFSHPNRDPMIDNNRYCTLEFPVEVNTVLHGFAGYFETVLYRDITLSIRPETHSPGMFSWFPIFFPIKQPITVHEGQNICVRFWRCSNSKKVWYEWAVTAPVCSSIHNPTGRSYTIGL